MCVDDTLDYTSAHTKLEHEELGFHSGLTMGSSFTDSLSEQEDIVDIVDNEALEEEAETEIEAMEGVEEVIGEEGDVPMEEEFSDSEQSEIYDDGAALSIESNTPAPSVLTRIFAPIKAFVSPILSLSLCKKQYVEDLAGCTIIGLGLAAATLLSDQVTELMVRRVELVWRAVVGAAGRRYRTLGFVRDLPLPTLMILAGMVKLAQVIL
jgi:hypothetical protein